MSARGSHSFPPPIDVSIVTFAWLDSMAYAEMRLILAHILWNFDLELVDNSDTWFTTQKTYLAWEKPPLMINIRERE